jgi:UPF0176 protein
LERPFSRPHPLCKKQTMNAPYNIATFYKFVPLDDYQQIRQPLLDYCRKQHAIGSILLAHEGINGTIAGTREAVDNVLAYIRTDKRLADLMHKEATAEEMPFGRMKVRLKKEIVHLGVPGIDPNKEVGTYVAPAVWNQLISDPEVTLIDTRNDYEVQVGSFKGALNPDTQSFQQFPAFVEAHLNPQTHKKIAMFCTGGIRCEKGTAYLLQQGFAEVFHLKGGILNYLESVSADESQWEGECFVFDRRTTVKHALIPGKVKICPTCQKVVSDEETSSPYYKRGIYCPACHDSVTPEKIASLEEKQKQIALMQKRATQK